MLESQDSSNSPTKSSIEKGMRIWTNVKHRNNLGNQ